MLTEEISSALPGFSLKKPSGTSALDQPGKALFVTVLAWSVYSILIGSAWYLESANSTPLKPLEASVAVIASAVTFAALTMRLVMVVSSKNGLPQGVTIVSFSITAMSALTSGIMGTCATPIIIDPVTNCQVYMFRWCEWVVLSFLMSFIVEAIDNNAHLTMAWVFASSISLSTACGLVLPYMNTLLKWWAVMVFSFITYFAIFPHAYLKWRGSRQHPPLDTPGLTPRAREAARRAHVAFKLMLVCSMLWTWFVTIYFLGWLHVHFVKPCSMEEQPHFPFVLDTLTDVFAKLVYTSVISQVAESVPDSFVAEEVKWFVEQMSVVWRRSTDVIVISTPVSSELALRAKHLAEAAALRGSDDGGGAGGGAGGASAPSVPSTIAVETSASASLRALIGSEADQFCQGKMHAVDLSTPSSSAHRGDDAEPCCFQHIVEDAWRASLGVRADGEVIALRSSGWRVRGADGQLVHLEAHISSIADKSALVVVVRDVTDRLRRHEAEMQLVTEQAEKKLIAQTVARQKDEETNRFTRHEVKNSMLAAMSTCDGLREMHESGVASGAIVNSDYDIAFQRRVKELGSTLKSTLDVVLAQAMARDVVHGSYTPRHEAVQLDKVLAIAEGSTERFKQTVCPSPFPSLSLDPALMHLVYRNALSNACKYGASGMPVHTHLEHDGWTLTVRVTNAAGPGHERVRRIEDPGRIFEKGVRLHTEADSGLDSGLATISAGDGAWIMRRCAEALGGSCSIRFLEDTTVFELRCPALVHVTPKQVESFAVPGTALACAIDDSPVQRLLLRKSLLVLGFDYKRVEVAGESDDDIERFDERLVKLVRDNPSARVLAVVDENLELSDRMRTVSGSLLVQRVRSTLSDAEEARLLAVVRSANDSPTDLAVYMERAHAVVPKESFDELKVLERFAPLWIQRFGMPAHAPIESFGLGVDELEAKFAEEVRALVAAVDAHALGAWPRVWPLLHQIKGHLRTMSQQPPGRAASVKAITTRIELYRGRADPPPRFADEEWPELRALITRHLQLSGHAL